MANFFIDRPIFAWVLAIILCLTGALAIFSLPVEQYPNLAPPNVRISATYPGASAQTLENTVTQIIEQNMTGLDNMMYMSSQSTNTGQATVTLTFEAGTDPNEAMQQVQNQLQAAIKRLPQAVQNQGVTVSKSGDTTLMMVAFVSTDNSMDKQDIADYIVSNLQDPLSRINGVGSMDVYGSQYAMRIWLDPNKLNSYQLTTQDVVKAIQSQNAQVAVGQLGGTPSVDKQALNATINAQSQLQTPEQFRQITLRVNQDGSLVTLGNVATVELGGENYNYLSRYNGMQAAGMNIKLASGANELQTDQLVKDKIAELSQYFPRGLEAKVAYETTPFVKASIKDVVKTLLEAILLVFLVMYLFLQNFRATLIPTIAVPVVLMGTFAILSACGFSINTLTMFAMVLAIGAGGAAVRRVRLHRGQRGGEGAGAAEVSGLAQADKKAGHRDRLFLCHHPMNLQILQQHDGLAVFNAAVGDHRHRFTERQFDHFDIFIFNAAAGRAPLIVMVFGDKEVHDFSHAARRHVRFEDFLHLADLKTGLLHRFAARALLRRVGVQQAGAGLEQHAALVAVDVGRHAELIGQHHRALGAVVQQNGSAVATIVDLAHLLHRTAVFAFQIERVLVQHIPVVRQQLFLHILNFRRHNPFPLRDNVKIIPRLGRAAADDLQQKSHRLSG